MTEFVGLLPAAGRGSRLGPIPCSKEIMPLGFQQQATPHDAQWRPVTAIELHLRALHLAGATRAVVVISESKYDIVRYIGDGSRYGLAIAYLYQQQLSGMPFALNLAATWVGNATTIFSMPDTLITPSDTASRLVRYHQQHAADVTLGLFHTTTPHKFGMVALGELGAIVRFVDKPQQTTLNLMWGLAVWSPRFTQFLSAFLRQLPSKPTEVVLSDVFQAALEHGLTIQGIPFDHAQYHDIGTPEDFQLIVYRLAIGHGTALK